MVHYNCLSYACALALTAASFLCDVRVAHSVKRLPCLNFVGQCRCLLHDSAAPWAKHAVTWLCLPAAKQDLSKADSPRQWVAAIYFITMTITTVSAFPVLSPPCLGLLRHGMSHIINIAFRAVSCSSLHGCVRPADMIVTAPQAPLMLAGGVWRHHAHDCPGGDDGCVPHAHWCCTSPLSL